MRALAYSAGLIIQVFAGVALCVVLVPTPIVTPGWGGGFIGLVCGTLYFSGFFLGRYDARRSTRAEGK